MTSGSMNILADENIPFVLDAFGALGKVELRKGRDISPDDVRRADILLVRSVTRVNERLLAGSKVRFVATATSGTDHVDRGFLSSRGIAFADAAGSNAVSVAEYVVAAILEYARMSETAVKGKTVGIVGVGHVGTGVAEKVKALGMKPVLNDPPRKEKTGLNIFRPIKEILKCDVVTMHVPLVREGRWPTAKLVDEDFLSKLKEGAFFINTSRGEVLDEASLCRAIRNRAVRFSCLDVWANEPFISSETLGLVSIGTPHIAGYSYDAKVRGTEMIHKALCDYLGIRTLWKARDVLASRGEKRISLSEVKARGVEELVRSSVRVAYDIMADDATLRSGAEFDLLRRNYPLRREFKAASVDAGDNEEAGEILSHLGFRVSFNPRAA